MRAYKNANDLKTQKRANKKANDIKEEVPEHGL